MPQFTPRLIRDMRNALEDVMTRVPAQYVTAAVKVYLAECILKAAAQGHTNYNELVTAAADQIQTAISLFTVSRATNGKGARSTEKNDATTHTSR
jgi:hypothetical protein